MPNLVKYVTGALSSIVGGGSSNSGGSGRGRKGGLRLSSNPNLALARQQILDYSGMDVLGDAASMRLSVDGIAQLEDINRYVAEQKELLKYAVKKIETITDNAVEMERMISEIVVHQLKTRGEVDKYLVGAQLAGDRYEANSAKLSQKYANTQRLLAGETAGEMALDNVQTKLALLRSKQKYDNAKKSVEVASKQQTVVTNQMEAENAVRRKQAEVDRHRMTKGDGNRPTGSGFTRFKSHL